MYISCPESEMSRLKYGSSHQFTCGFWMPSEMKESSRRNALKIIIGAGILAIAGVVASTLRVLTGSPETVATTTSPKAVIVGTSSTMVAPTTATSELGATNAGLTAWPRLLATNVKSLQLLTPLVFDYPIVGASNLIVKLGVKADNGVGPDGDIVAFNRICQHQGCIYGYLSAEHEGYCPCHGSIYDFVHNGAVIGGPAPNPVPRVLLEHDEVTGDIYIVGMGPPAIYGSPCAATDTLLKCDVGTGQIVTQITLSPQ
jgi:arsenite oxidase small subunit